MPKLYLIFTTSKYFKNPAYLVVNEDFQFKKDPKVVIIREGCLEDKEHFSKLASKYQKRYLEWKNSQ